MNTSDIISLASLLIALTALLYSWITDRKLKKYQLLLSKDEYENKKKAFLSAQVENSSNGRNTSYCITIKNEGMAPARSIKLFSEDMDKEGSGVQMIIRNGKLPYPILQPGAQFEIPLSLYVGHTLNPCLKIIWDDDSGENMSCIHTLDL